MMQLEDLQLSVKAFLSECKDFLGCPPDDRSALLPAFCEAMTDHIARLETVSG